MRYIQCSMLSLLRITQINLLLAVAILLPMSLLAQNRDSLAVADYSTPANFEIGGVRVTGAQFSDANAITSISGLKVGDKIRIPGPIVPKAIKALLHLRLFTNVQIIQEKTIGDVIFLEIQVQERPRLSLYNYKGVGKGQHETLNEIVNQHITKGGIVTDNMKSNAARALEKNFIKKGWLDVNVDVKETPDTARLNSVKLLFDINLEEKVKIKDISFIGVTNVKEKKLLKKMDKTKEKKRFLAGSKFIGDEYDGDKKDVIKYFNTVGYRDARILSDSIWRDAKGDMHIQLKVNEGNRYYFRNIAWKGNSIYDNEALDQVLGIKKGDIYNQELLENRLRFSQDSRDVSTLYMDNGYLFFNVDPTEVSVIGDSIDLELRIFEGPQATIDKVIIKGNDRTHEHVIRRELRTLPGEKFSRSEIIRSQRQILALNYFNPEKLDIQTPVNAERGTVDIQYVVEERPADQLELSAGWGGARRVIGTLGVSFNNFSMRNVFNKESWRPLPTGDGQRLSIRAQTNGQFYQSYNVSFTEPWLGGHKPNSFTVGGFFNRFAYPLLGGGSQSLNITQGSVSLGTRLKWPDDNFVSSTALNIQSLKLNQWTQGLFRTDQGEIVSTGTFNNFSIRQNFTRSTINDPTFPKDGSNISLVIQATPPYSLFNPNKNYGELSANERFRFLEYHKWKFDFDWYTTITGKLVLKTSSRIGILGFYNKKIGTSPFERFQVGGDGLNNQQFGFQGVDIVSARGYEIADFENNADPSGSGQTPTPIFNKFTLELRYPLSLNPSSTIYVHTFMQGVNTWKSLRDYNPFDLKRSVGMGLRVFLPMFGILGFDYGLGFDKPGATKLFSKGVANFNIVLGFEPE
ncbi:POTRA domain-containing protein [Haliscomenobacter sp.]|uniref:BamA/OMP85 family outer membrane protein n=1 Tax=Haliscomenobacter sp. TaxID=2717303 RepID=UPI003364BCBC